MRILQAFLWPKIGKNQLLKAEKINRRATIIWEVRVRTRVIGVSLLAHTGPTKNTPASATSVCGVGH